jgi:hypothetical protein
MTGRARHGQESRCTSPSPRGGFRAAQERPVQGRGSMARVFEVRLVLGVAMALAATACDEPDDETDAIAIERTGATLQVAPGLARLAGGYAPNLDVEGIPDDELQVLAVQQAETRLGLLLALTACEGTIESDGATTVRAIFSSCPLYGWRLSGDITGTVSVDTPPCDDGVDCPPRIATWRLDIGSYMIDRLVLEDIEVSGAIEVSRELVPGGALRWATEDLLVDGIAGRTITSTSQATLAFSGTDDQCLTIDASARFSVQAEDATDEAIGEVVLSARGVQTCQGRCPREGRVDLAFGAGRVLRFDYEGDARVRVIGPRGRSLHVSLPCTPE